MPNSLEWKEDYKIGIESIDDQHKCLFDIIARIANLDAATSNKEELKNILGELSAYMHQHFEDEENFMRKIKYPELKDHQKIHQEIIDFINITVKNSPTLKIIQTKLKFVIKKLLVDHITLEDMKYKLYLSQNTEMIDNSTKGEDISDL